MTSPRHGSLLVLGGPVFVLVTSVLTGWATLPDTPAGIVTPSPAVQLALPVCRGLFFLTTVAVLAVHLRPLLAGARETHPDPRTAWLLLLGLSSACALFVLQTVDAAPEQRPTASAVLTYATASTGWTVSATVAAQLVFFVLTVLEASWAIRLPALARPGLAAAPVLVLSSTGHALDETGWQRALACSLIALHVGGALAWSAGLIALLAGVLTGSLGAREISRFSGLAGVCLVVVGTTGVGFAALHVASETGTAWSLPLGPYVVLVGSKTMCFLLLCAFGAVMRARVLPRARGGQFSRFVQVAALETTVVGMAFGLAVVLSNAPLT